MPALSYEGVLSVAVAQQLARDIDSAIAAGAVSLRLRIEEDEDSIITEVENVTTNQGDWVLSTFVGPAPAEPGA